MPSTSAQACSPTSDRVLTRAFSLTATKISSIKRVSIKYFQINMKTSGPWLPQTWVTPDELYGVFDLTFEF